MPDVELRASDGHEFRAHRVDSATSDPQAAVVVLQEIFGVNRHIQAVTARFAAAGYTAIAPAFFDRIEPGLTLGYGKADVTRGRELVGKLETNQVLDDLAATIAHAADHAGPSRAVHVVGYCWGGALAWLAAARLDDIQTVVSYYGSRIVNYIDEGPRVPLMMHVGREDASFPIEKVREVAARYPRVEVHEYEAGHGFNCDHRSNFDSAASATALARTLAFFEAS